MQHVCIPNLTSLAALIPSLQPPPHTQLQVVTNDWLGTKGCFALRRGGAWGVGLGGRRGCEGLPEDGAEVSGFLRSEWFLEMSVFS